MKKVLFFLGLVMACSTQILAQTHTIQQVQFVTDPQLNAGNDLSSIQGQNVSVDGYVTFNPCAYGLPTIGERFGTWIQATSTPTAWGGVHVLIDSIFQKDSMATIITMNNYNLNTQFSSNMVVGNKVRVTGRVTTFQGNTQIILDPNTPVQILSLGNPPATSNITKIDSFQKNIAGTQTIQRLSGEKWEGSLIELQNVTVVNASLGNGTSTGRYFWSVQDGNGNIFRIRDVSGWLRDDVKDKLCNPAGYTPFSFIPWAQANLTNGTTLSYLKGIAVQSGATVAEYYIAPRDTTDIGARLAAAPVITNRMATPRVPTSAQAVTVKANVVDPDGTVAAVSCYYALGLASTTWSNVPMTNAGGGLYTGTIPAAPNATWVKYYIKATDNSGLNSYSPDSLATNSNYLVRDGGITQISHIQGVSLTNGNSIYGNDTLVMNITGTATATTGLNDLGFVVIQNGTAPYSGILLKNISGDGLDTVRRGDILNITKALVRENFGFTQLENVTYTVTSRGNTLPAYSYLNEDTVRLGNTTNSLIAQVEPYESMLMEYTSQKVISNNQGNGEWSIHPTATAAAGMLCDDLSNEISATFNTASLVNGNSYNYFRGIMYYSFSNFKLAPRDLNDIWSFVKVNTIPGSQIKEVKLFPNPAANFMQTLFDTEKSFKGTLQVTDITGKILMQQNLQAQIGKNQIGLNVQNLANGSYIIKITDNNNKQMFAGKFNIIK